MRKRLLVLLFISGVAQSATYIGDSIAYGFGKANQSETVARVGASPKEVHDMIRHTNADKVVLSTGASNNCQDTKTIISNIALAQFKYPHLSVLTAPYCGRKVDELIHTHCKYTCTVIPIVAGKDGIHPQYFKFK